MASFNKFNDFTEQLIRGIHDWDAHAFKVALSNTAPEATNTVLADITQIANGNGYTTGGEATTITLSETSGTTTVQGTQITWTATGTLTFRYAVLYNDTAANDNLIGWWDYGSALTLANAGDTFTWKPNNTSPGTILTIA